MNLALVIDCSGSMSGDRITHVKQALLAMASKLRESDRLSIVAFSSGAEVIYSDNAARQREYTSAIERLQAEGNTNMHAGLMLGYQEVAAHFDKRHTNRVILLTDGITNTGVTDTETILTNSSAFNEDDIDLTTIGLGDDLNHDLLRDLANSGRGLIHFVGDAKDIKKVFINELTSLLSPQARRLRLEIEYDKSLKLKQVYGYQPQLAEGRIVVPLADLNASATQVVLAEFRARGKQRAKEFAVTVRLTYEDVTTGRQMQHQQEATLTYTQESTTAGEAIGITDPEVRKNYTIAQLAQALHDMSAHWEQGNYEQAQREIAAAIQSARKRYPDREDRDIERVTGIARKYSKAVSERLAAQRSYLRVPRIRIGGM